MSQKNFDIREHQPLAVALYALAAMWMTIPFVELGSQLGWTFAPQAINWRTGVVGLMSSVVLSPTLGLVIALVTAVVFGHRWAHRVLTAVAGLAAVLTLATVVLFTLDALQLKGLVAQGMQASFKFATLKAGLNFTIASITLFVVFFSSFRLLRRERKARESESPARPTRVPLVGTVR
jgi:hypothetical protein